ncbi:MAG TPA: ATP-binding protein, partial [Candidatus Dormibacteraeota bacterium]|nr:ATP-binding protein [Candidatus Dormibacteraeota bacterium]
GPSGAVLASRGVHDALAAEMVALEAETTPHLAAVGAAGTAVVAPLPLVGGRAKIVVLPGPFSPVFGADEIERLGVYAVSVASAIERTRLVDALRRQRDRYEGILGAMSDLGEGFVMTRDSQVVYANDAYSQLIGYSPAELAELPPTLATPAPPAGGADHHANGAASNGGGSNGNGSNGHASNGEGDGHFETSIVARDGHRVDVEVATKRLEGDPEAEKIAICRDITQRLRDQHELVRRSNELQRSNAALEDFAYIASHDLQEPLRMVASYLELLERRHSSELDGEALEFLGFAVDGAKRMQALINDLLLYSRAGGLSEEPRPTDCNVVLQRVLATLRSTIEEGGASVTVGELPVVTAHATELVQVFQNLVGNALKFRGERAPVISIGADLDGDHWVFSVRDNGLGIEPRHAERIFMIFKRLHAPQRYAGTGIGLAICKRVVERRGGRIWVEPAEGGGSVFRFTLPHEGAARVRPPRAMALSS